MRVAAIYDIHGNLPALLAVLEDIRAAGVDRIVAGGDVLPGPMPLKTISCLLDLEIPVQFILGNGDREVLARMRGVKTDWFRSAPEAWKEPVCWSAKQLSPEHERLLADWPQTLTIDITGLGNVLFCHATPRSDTETFTRLTPEETLLPIFQGVEAPLVICGHTHVQFDRMIGSTRVINAGSVGMPFEGRGAYWVLLGSEVQLRRTPYDLDGAAEQIRNAEYPQAADFARRYVLRISS